MVLKLNSVKVVVPKLTKRKKKKGAQKTGKIGEEMEEEQEAPVSLAIHVNNIFHSIFAMLKCTSTNSKFTNQLDFMRTSVSLPTTSDYKGVMHREAYDYEELFDEIMEAPLSEPFFTRRKKMLNRPEGSCCFVNWGLTFSPRLNSYIQM